MPERLSRAPGFDRALCALFGGALVTLAALVLGSLALGRQFNLLSQESLLAARWYALYLWFAATALLALPRTLLAVWRQGLRAVALALALIPVAHAWTAWRVGAPTFTSLNLGVAATCILLSAACLAVARALRPAPAPQRSPAAGASPRHWRQHAQLALAAAAIVLAFRDAASVLPPAGAAALGLLAAFFLTLPAASLAPWLPRASALLHCAAGAAFAWVGWWVLAAASTAAGILALGHPLAAPVARARQRA